MTHRQARILAVLSTACFMLALLLSRRIWFRLDITETRSYTISPVSRDLYQEIPDQVRITYYLSDKLASIHPVPGEIEDLLREYAARSRGRIRFMRRDPVKANLTETVEQLGILPQQIQTMDNDEASITTVYTGILIEYLDRIDVLPSVFSLETLEYDLTSRIRAMARDVEREVGVIVGDAGRQWSEYYGYLNQAFIQAGFKVRLLNPGEEISDVLPALFVLGGAEDLDDWALYRIDRYIRGGGKVLFALEGVAVDTRYGFEARVLEDRGLLSMLSSYGVTVKPNLVLDRSALIIPLQTAEPGGNMLVRYPFWIGVLEQFGNADHPVSSGFSRVDLYWASPLELKPPAGVEGTILFTSTPEAWLQTREFQVNPDAAYLFGREEADTRGTKVLAAALSGTFPGYFAGAPKPLREGSGEELPDLPAEARDSRIVVVGDSDLASGFIRYTRSQRNLDFLLQAADWLCNDDAITAIRSRQARIGRLDRIVDPQKRAAAMAFARILNVVIIPLGVVLAGFFIAARRRRVSSGNFVGNSGNNRGSVPSDGV
jgi:gliding-associated putative ABC transporter substrate-binding component GldG